MFAWFWLVYDTRICKRNRIIIRFRIRDPKTIRTRPNLESKHFYTDPDTVFSSPGSEFSNFWIFHNCAWWCESEKSIKKVHFNRCWFKLLASVKPVFRISLVFDRIHFRKIGTDPNLDQFLNLDPVSFYIGNQYRPKNIFKI